MNDKEEYGIEDLCESLDGIEKQLKKLIYAYCLHNGLEPKELEDIK